MSGFVIESINGPVITTGGGFSMKEMVYVGGKTPCRRGDRPF